MKDLQEIYEDFISSEDQEFDVFLSKNYCNGLDLNLENLSDYSKDHISNLIKEGYKQGEVYESFLNKDDSDCELRGWWSLEKGRVAVSINI